MNNFMPIKSRISIKMDEIPAKEALPKLVLGNGGSLNNQFIVCVW